MYLATACKKSDISIALLTMCDNHFRNSFWERVKPCVCYLSVARLRALPKLTGPQKELIIRVWLQLLVDDIVSFISYVA